MEAQTPIFQSPAEKASDHEIGSQNLNGSLSNFELRNRKKKSRISEKVIYKKIKIDSNCNHHNSKEEINS
jgi:hypothetical protein